MAHIRPLRLLQRAYFVVVRFGLIVEFVRPGQHVTCITPLSPRLHWLLAAVGGNSYKPI